MLASVLDRMVDFMDRHEKQERRKDQDDYSRVYDKASATAERSQNPDFTGLIRNQFQLIQATHHIENWRNIPTRLDEQIDRVIANIRPPLPGRDIEEKLSSAATAFKSAILTAVQSHTQECANTARASLRSLDHRDWDLAEDKARFRYHKRFRSRARPETVRAATKDLEGLRRETWHLARAPRHPKEDSRPRVTRDTHNQSADLDALLEAVDRLDRQTTTEDPVVMDADEPEGVEAAAPPNPPTPATKSTQPNIRVIDPDCPEPGDENLLQCMITNMKVDTRPYPKVLVSDQEHRERWTMEMPISTVQNVIVCDSNGLAWYDTDVPENTVVYAFRDAQLSDALKLTPVISAIPHFTSVFFALGAEDRRTDIRESIATLHGIHRWSRRCKKNVFIAGIPHFDALPPDELSCINDMNNCMASLFDGRYIPPVPHHLIEPDTLTQSHVRYTENTAQAILDSFSLFL